ncbi:myosin-11 isoform X2 [Drosophila montana]|uniref:myosin-11 isoform X2 n=1 Tax=Drosophila montana TaxID=40370 RepID=UPI00313DAAB0
MQNSAVVSRVPHKVNVKNVPNKTVASETKKQEATNAQHPKPPIKRMPINERRAAGVLGANNNKSSKVNSTITPLVTPSVTPSVTRALSPAVTASRAPSRAPSRPSSPPPPPAPVTCLEVVKSSTSMISRRTDADSEEVLPKLKNKFTKPRLNQLTEQRISRCHAENVENAAQVSSPSPAPLPRTRKKEPSLTSMSLHSQQEAIEPTPCPQPLEALQKQLEDMQSEFMQKAASFREKGYGYAYKLVTIVHNDNCKVLVHNDDLLALPKNLPVQSVSDFKHLCHDVFKAGFKFIFEQFASVQLAKDEATVAACREELRVKLNGELNNKLVVVDNELMQMCSAAGKEDNSSLVRQVCELSAANTQLKCTNAKLDLDIADVRKNREDLKKMLESSQKRNNDLALELADKNISLVEQTSVIDDLRTDLKHMKKVTKVLNQRLKENDTGMDSLRQTINTQLERIEDLQAQLYQADADRLFLKKKTEELTLIVADKDRQIAEQRRQLHQLEQYKDWQEGQTESTICSEQETAQISELQTELERQQTRLTAQEQAEQSLRNELELKQEALRKAELKMGRLEEQIEHHRQVLAVRGERINYLDQEMKQREQESNRKINEIMSQTSDKNTLITQISNELASTNEQFQNLCSTLSTKQTKLHSQEHVIKLLEESNARSVKLHTKLGEKNALLKDELDHLRRTVHIYVKILIGNNGQNIFEPVPAHEVLSLRSKRNKKHQQPQLLLEE